MGDRKPNPLSPVCTCVQDPFADVPSELRPKLADKMGGLRKLTCPGCGLAYRTNRKTDTCPECEKKGIRLPEGQNGECNARVGWRQIPIMAQRTWPASKAETL